MKKSYKKGSEGTTDTLVKMISIWWNSFWAPPGVDCPKCGCDTTDYYDPFFFAPLRTLNGKRRIKCTHCHFIWRPSRSRKSFFDFFKF